ncbi:hypothetical protein RRG08_045023 [Elysia crispata]|uniref:Uncharacterized protein n=1 Tax=Elysia crispata TaxID=231223 RepID=A0AAE1CS18_9GAST|nr:hypothetical protein RRG08_045023 [Elysia crispata]
MSRCFRTLIKLCEADLSFPSEAWARTAQLEPKVTGLPRRPSAGGDKDQVLERLGVFARHALNATLGQYFLITIVHRLSNANAKPCSAVSYNVRPHWVTIGQHGPLLQKIINPLTTAGCGHIHREQSDVPGQCPNTSATSLTFIEEHRTTGGHSVSEHGWEEQPVYGKMRVLWCMDFSVMGRSRTQGELTPDREKVTDWAKPELNHRCLRRPLGDSSGVKGVKNKRKKLIR